MTIPDRCRGGRFYECWFTYFYKMTIMFAMGSTLVALEALLGPFSIADHHLFARFSPGFCPALRAPG
jgi:hypothetical protein